MQQLARQIVETFRLEMFLQLSLATLFGGAIGLERELGGKPAGLRTNILICIGSVLYTKLSITMAGGNADPTRIAAQIVTGVGFIGAGTILHARGAVVGLTSAATIWVVAAIGVALGGAFYWKRRGPRCSCSWCCGGWGASSGWWRGTGRPFASPASWNRCRRHWRSCGGASVCRARIR